MTCNDIYCNVLILHQEAGEMNERLKVGIIGDYDPQKYFSHMSTNEALSHAASALSVSVDSTWLPTRSLAGQPIRAILEQFDALWCAPGSPYESMDGALQAIRFAREMGWPFIAT
jgi:CTP synthase (UTP-ammonia lyase)